MGDVVHFPITPLAMDSKADSVQTNGPKVATLVISDSVFSMPPEAFPFPSTPAVCPKYLKALQEQKKKQNDS